MHFKVFVRAFGEWRLIKRRPLNRSFIAYFVNTFFRVSFVNGFNYSTVDLTVDTKWGMREKPFYSKRSINPGINECELYDWSNDMDAVYVN